jgi:excisionase family DNA binding protein
MAAILAFFVLLLLRLFSSLSSQAAATTTPPARRLYSIQEVAQLLSVTVKHVYEMAYAGQLATVKLGRRRLVTAEELDRFIASLSAA